MTVHANIFQPLIDVFNGLIVLLHDEVGLGWGTSIIALTVIIRALLVPLAVKQYRSMQAMAKVAPQLKAIKEKYKDDPQRSQQEQMKFMREAKVNPFASCLPLLAQLPVFLALFYALREDLRQDICNQTERPCGEVAGFADAAEFFFVPDLTDKATGGVLVTLIILYVVSQLFSSLLMLRTSPTMDKTQRTIMLALPFVFVPFILGFPAGLIVYWITTNFWTMVQQQTIRKLIPPTPPAEPDTKTDKPAKGAPAVAAAAAGGGNGASGASKAPPPPPRRKKKRSGRRR